jgi:PTH1 family peptidyl-tRNA hydrolase
MQTMHLQSPILAIIGLGNPGRQYYHNRHNIGFKIIDALADRYGGEWRERENMESTEININGKKVILIKPQTFMNSSGKVLPYLLKQGIKPENILVIHDELELPFGSIKFKMGGSHKGHNGLKSIISVIGDQFPRLRFGIGRPDDRNEVPNYVLQNFKESDSEIENLVRQSIDMIESLF